MPKHHQRPTRHSSTHPRPHPHADIHSSRSTTSSHPTKKPRRLNPLNLYHTTDPPSPPSHSPHPPRRPARGAPPPPPTSTPGADARYDWDSQQRYEYELPDEFVDEEVDEEEAFGEGEEEKWGDAVDTILGRRRGKGGRGGKGGNKGRVKGGVKNEEEEEVVEESEQGSEEDEDAGAVDEDDEMEEGMTTLSALLDEPDEDDEKALSRKPSLSSRPGKRTRQQRREEEEKEEEKAGGEADDDEGLMKDADVDDEEDEHDEMAEDDGEEQQDVDEELEGEGDEEEDEEAVSGEEEEQEEEEEEEEDPALSSAKRGRLLSAIQQLEAEDQQRKAVREAKQSRATAEDAGLEESEFAAIRMPSSTSASSSSSSSGKLTLAALMESLQGKKGAATVAAGAAAASATESRRTLATLKRKLSALHPPVTSAQSTATTPLAEPLPEIRQDEITRRLSYATVQKELERWAPIVEHHLTAPTLHFPLHAPPVHQPSNRAAHASFKGDESRQLEKDLHTILHSITSTRRSGAAESREEESGLRERELTEEEVERRRAELAKLKSLLFHSELKARRVNAIKSKAYRRLRKKAKERAELSLEELERMDPEEAERRRMKAEVARVQERMSLSHTNSSAWIKRQLRVNHNVNNADVKQALHTAAALAQRLRRKIDHVDEHRGSDEEDEEDGEQAGMGADEEGAEDGEEEEQKGGSKAAQLKAALRALEREKSSDEEKEEVEEEMVGFDPAKSEGRGHQTSARSSQSGVLNLKFMQKAMEEKRAQAKEARQQLEDDLKEELDRAQRDSDEEDAVDNQQQQRAGEKQPKGGQLQGRRRIGGGADDSVERREGAKDDGGVSLLLPGSFQSVSVGLAKGTRVRADAALDIDVDAPRDLTAERRADELFDIQAFPDDEDTTGATPAPLQHKKAVSRAVQAAATTSAPTSESGRSGELRWSGARRGRQQEVEEKGGQEEENPWAQATDVPARRELREEEQKQRRRRRTTASTSEPDVPTNIDVHSVLLPSTSTSTDGSPSFDDSSLEQRALVREAFAVGEDEEANFAKLKAALVEESLPTAPSSSALPGWGAWVGDGVQSRPSRYQQRKDEAAQRRLQEKRRQALSSRADARLPAVIISEKSDVRASKFLLARLPFPYTSVSAYEQSLRQPLGKEWNSVEAHARVIVPSVQVDKGAIIEPVTFHESARERKAEEMQREEREQKKRDAKELQGGKGGGSKPVKRGQLKGKGQALMKSGTRGHAGSQRRGLDGKKRKTTSTIA